MRINLVDSQNNEDVAIDLKVETSFTPNGMLAIFAKKQGVVGFTNGKNSAPYDEFCFKKVISIIVGTVNHEGYHYTLTLGTYLDYSDIKFFLIKEQGNDKYIRFSDDVELNDMLYEDVKLCNYQEYKDVCEITGKNTPTIREFISDVCNGQISYNDYSLYNTTPNQTNLNLFINNTDFFAFLDQEEVRTGDNSL